MKRIFVFLVLFGIFELKTVEAAERPLMAPRPAVSYAGTGTIDASDREYMTKLREVIGFSSKQIDVSLARISVSDHEKDAVNLVLQDLMDAAKRGAAVRMFINTYSEVPLNESFFLREDKLEFLKKNGVKINFLNPRYHLSDQIVVVDEDKILEGGPAWTHKDLTEGLGSASLSFSTSLAQKKRVRLELLPLWNLKVEKESTAVGELAVPLFLLKDVKYFPSMVRLEDGDALKVYLFLLEKFFAIHQAAFTVSTEELAQLIPSERTMDRAIIIHQVMEILERLSRNYELLTIKNNDPSKLEVELKLPDQIAPNIHVPLTFFHENYVKDLSSRAIFAYLVIRYRLQSSGESPVWIGSERNVEQDFPMTREDFRVAVDELRRKNLIEIYPFNLRQGTSYTGPEILEYRYLVNELVTLSERLETWSRLRDQFGDTDFKRARDLTEIFGEPEDPKVVIEFLKLLGQYTFTDVQSLTQHLSTLPPSSTPNQLNYLQQLLRHETQGMQGLGVD